MRKYLFNGSLLSAIAGGWSIFQTTKEGPRDWRLILMWISWGLTIAIAAGTIAKQAQDSYDLES
ncbi:hypothetical protein [Salinibacterium sp. PAMC 21357]|uniref:hypothetical protein n=1 Tax=Salinibacterium sp. PAMC 21357 TaxID=1112215 RepID=UPI000288865E|nr:hypothetical protein [Salinibacterium sp. PAMC 21357]